MAGRKGIKPRVAEHVRGEFERAEHVGKGGIADIEAAGIGAERRHHHAGRIRGEAAARYGAAAMRDPRHWMQMARDFAGHALRDMAEGQRPDRQRAAEGAADILGRLGVVTQFTGRPAEAEALCREAIALLEARGDREGAASVMVNLVSILWRLGRAEVERRRLLLEAIRALEAAGSGAELVFAYSQMASLELF